MANKCLYGPECKFQHSIPNTISPSDENDGRLASSQASFAADQDDFISDNVQFYEAEVQPIGDLSRRISLSLPSLTTTSSHQQTSYATNISGSEIALAQSNNVREEMELPLCPYSEANGTCPFPEGHCSFIHCIECDLCNRFCLHPYDTEQQQKHRDECLLEHEREMELSFAIQRSKDKVCGICMEVVTEKKPVTFSRFGILDKCNHIFCVDCIRRWRGNKSLEVRTIRSCPQCRVSSDFVVPSKYWVEDKEDKEKLIQEYKTALKVKPCKYFNEGAGECPFGSSCFYKHAYPDGSIATSVNPRRRRRKSLLDLTNFILWDILTTNEDDWSNDELESLYLDPDYGTTYDEDDEDPDTDSVQIPDTESIADFAEEW